MHYDTSVMFSHGIRQLTSKINPRLVRKNLLGYLRAQILCNTSCRSLFTGRGRLKKVAPGHVVTRLVSS